MSANTKMVIISLITIFFIILDRWFKAVAVNVLSFGSLPLTPWLKLSLHYNRYIAFSLPWSGWLLTALISLLIIILSFSYWRYRKSQLYLEAGYLFAVIVGAISNLLDRWRYQAVVDYIDLSYFTVFNLADVLICLGTAGLIWQEWKRHKQTTISKQSL